MSSITPRSTILALTEPLPEEKQEEAVSRYDEIRKVLEKNPELRGDSVLMNRVSSFARDHKEKIGKVLMERLLLESNPPINTLILSKTKLNNNIWDTLLEQGVEKLIIEKEGEPIVYDQRALKQLLEIRPSFESLAETCILEFEDGGNLVETKAHLHLCGGIVGVSLEDTDSEKIPFSGTPISKENFEEILKEVKTGERELSDEAYEIACDFLDYTKWTGIPENAFGPVQWNELFGLEVTDVPEVPQNIIDKIAVLKAENRLETHKLILMPAGLSLNQMEELAKTAKGGHQTQYGYCWGPIRDLHGSTSLPNSHWILMQTTVLEESRGRPRENQLALARDQGEGYDAPTLLEAVALNFVTFAETGERLFSTDPRTYTVCSEESIRGWKLVVGGFAPAGLCVLDDGDSVDVGVAPVLR